MDRLTAAAWLALASIAVALLGSLGTLGWRTLETSQAIAVVALVAAFVGASVLFGRRGAGPRTPYW